MNRREAIAALVALPGVTRISKADLKPTDVIVLECDGPISNACVDRLQEGMKKIWPNHKVAILAAGLRMKVVSG